MLGNVLFSFRLDVIVFDSGRVDIDVRITESAIAPGTVVDANITFNVKDNAIVFGVSCQT